MIPIQVYLRSMLDIAFTYDGVRQHLRHVGVIGLSEKPPDQASINLYIMYTNKVVLNNNYTSKCK